MLQLQRKGKKKFVSILVKETPVASEVTIPSNRKSQVARYQPPKRPEIS